MLQELVKAFLIKLRKILLYDILYISILLIVLFTVIIRIIIPNNSKYNNKVTEITGKIINISKEDNKITLLVKAKEKVLVKYYLKDKEKFNYQLGDKIKINGSLEKPSKNTYQYLFNYQKYLENKDIYYILTADSLELISINKNIYYYLKQKIINYLNDPYLLTFILGDKSKIKDEVIKSYQKNGISHLFAISGMHITILSTLVLKLLKKLKISEKKRYFITMLILLFYLSITNQSASVLRGVLFFILFSINKIYYFYIKPTNIFILTISIALLINENYIFDIGFLYSYSISLALIIMSSYLKGKNYLITLLKVSIISFLVSLPISLFNFYEINILSIIYNLIFVPFVSIIIFPLALLTCIFSFLLPLFSFLTTILEKLSLILSNINILLFNFPRLNIFIYFLYAILVIIVIYAIKENKFKYTLILFIALLLHYIYPYFIKKIYIEALDVGQGDSILLNLNNKIVLIDTGGIISYNNKQSYSIVINKTIPLLKNRGIKKIDYLILTHGDYDHMGEAQNLVNNFKVKNVIFNNGNYNKLELDLIKILETKNINFYQNIKNLNIKNHTIYFLNDITYDNENDNSIVLYTEIFNYKLLLMGDASVEVEKNILKKYNLDNIDILKVGHHGSKTSSNIDFLNKTNPTYSIISVGKDNKFNHPNTIVLENLKNSTIYRTDKDGSIIFKIKNNNLKIETFAP